MREFTFHKDNEYFHIILEKNNSYEGSFRFNHKEVKELKKEVDKFLDSYKIIVSVFDNPVEIECKVIEAKKLYHELKGALETLVGIVMKLEIKNSEDYRLIYFLDKEDIIDLIDYLHY